MRVCVLCWFLGQPQCSWYLDAPAPRRVSMVKTCGTDWKRVSLVQFLVADDETARMLRRYTPLQTNNGGATYRRPPQPPQDATHSTQPAIYMEVDRTKRSNADYPDEHTRFRRRAGHARQPPHLDRRRHRNHPQHQNPKLHLCQYQCLIDHLSHHGHNRMQYSS